MKTYKRILIMAAATLLAVGTAGCTKLSENFNEHEETTMESQTSAEEGLLSKAESRMREFITAVNIQNYEGISSMIYMPEKALITDDNIQWYITRTTLADITGISIEKLEIKVPDGSIKKNVEVYVNKTGYAFEMVLDSNNNWKIVLPELYVENWSLKIPKGCGVEVNGTDISEYRIPATVVDEYDTYTFPAVAAQKMTVKTTSSVYGEFTQDVTPLSNSESVPVICKINEDETNNILARIADIWNGIYKDYTNNVGVESVKKYFTDDFDATEITNIMTIYLPQLETGESVSGYKGEVRYSNFYMKEAIPWTKDNYGSVLLKSDNCVEVNFGYRIDFVAPLTGGSYSVRKASKITMAYVDAPELGNGAKTYKIKKLDETKIFNDNNYNLNDY